MCEGLCEGLVLGLAGPPSVHAPVLGAWEEGDIGFEEEAVSEGMGKLPRIEDVFVRKCYNMLSSPPGPSDARNSNLIRTKTLFEVIPEFKEIIRKAGS